MHDTYASLNHATRSRTDGPPRSADPHRLVAIAATTVGQHGVRVHCGLTLIGAGGVPETVAATDDIPVRMDLLQYELRRGPFIGTPLPNAVSIADLRSYESWQEFSSRCATEIGPRSMRTVRIPLQGRTTGMLSFYSSTPSAFGDQDGEKIARFASLIIPTADALACDLHATRTAFPLGRTNRVGKALKMVARLHGVTDAEAFSRLVRASIQLNRSLVNLASHIIWERRSTADEPTSHTRGSGGLPKPPRQDLSPNRLPTTVTLVPPTKQRPPLVHV